MNTKSFSLCLVLSGCAAVPTREHLTARSRDAALLSRIVPAVQSRAAVEPDRWQGIAKVWRLAEIERGLWRDETASCRRAPTAECPRLIRLLHVDFRMSLHDARCALQGTDLSYLDFDARNLSCEVE